MALKKRSSTGVWRNRDVAVGGRDGKPPAFADVYDEHLSMVYGYFGYRVNSQQLTEDLTQSTFERALKAWARYDPSRSTASTWLLAIARNLLIDHYRRNDPVPVDPLGDHFEQEAAHADGAHLGVSPTLESALRALSDRDREVVALRFGGDLSGAAIAEAMGLSVANVQQILSRSLRRLREALEETSETPISARRERAAAERA